MPTEQQILDVLAKEGFRGTIDDDGDVTFKYEGIVYFVFLDKADESYLTIETGFGGFDAEAYHAARDIAMTLIKDYKVGKCALREPEHGTFTAIFRAETFASLDIFQQFLVRHLSLLRDMASEFNEKIEAVLAQKMPSDPIKLQ